MIVLLTVAHQSQCYIILIALLMRISNVSENKFFFLWTGNEWISRLYEIQNGQLIRLNHFVISYAPMSFAIWLISLWILKLLSEFSQTKWKWLKMSSVFVLDWDLFRMLSRTNNVDEFLIFLPIIGTLNDYFSRYFYLQNVNISLFFGFCVNK